MGIEYIILLILLVEYSIFLPKIFAKGGINEKSGYLPLYNIFVMIKLMKKPWWWILFLPVPGVNLLMLMAMNLELARVFNLYTAGDTLLSIFVPHILLPKIALKEEVKFNGPTDWKNEKDRKIRKLSDEIVLFMVSVGIFNVAIALYKMIGAKDKQGSKTIVKEWGDALLFAIVAASIIRTFFLEAFKIPTPSMEKNLLVGDFLFVSKISYGPKIPQTPIAVPFVHHTLPLVESKSFLEIFTLPYYRLPGLGKVQRNDVVVFNFPAGDSVKIDEQDKTYYQIIVKNAFKAFKNAEGRKYENALQLINEFEKKKTAYMNSYRESLISENMIIRRPVDKEDHYIKRCVAIADDSLEIKDGDLYINKKRSGDTENMQYFYVVTPTRSVFMGDELKQKFKEDFDIDEKDIMIIDGGRFFINIPNKHKKEIAAIFGGMKCLVKAIEPRGSSFNMNSDSYFDVFPNDVRYDWSKDNFGPLWVPKRGKTAKLNSKTLALYRRIIEVYENNSVKVKGEDIFINNKKVTEYTFKQDYYWLMGDNRHNSLDSRFWGFVPEDHVVGKGVLVWFSNDPNAGIRWNRIFSLIR